MTCRALQEIDVREQLDRRDPLQESAIPPGAGKRSDSKRALDGKTAEPVVGALLRQYNLDRHARNCFVWGRGGVSAAEFAASDRDHVYIPNRDRRAPRGLMGVTAFELVARLCREERIPALAEVRCSTTP
jgi:hypothetical protein